MICEQNKRKYELMNQILTGCRDYIESNRIENIVEFYDINYSEEDIEVIIRSINELKIHPRFYVEFLWDAEMVNFIYYELRNFAICNKFLKESHLGVDIEDVRIIRELTDFYTTELRNTELYEFLKTKENLTSAHVACAKELYQSNLDWHLINNFDNPNDVNRFTECYIAHNDYYFASLTSKLEYVDIEEFYRVYTALNDDDDKYYLQDLIRNMPDKPFCLSDVVTVIQSGGTIKELLGDLDCEHNHCIRDKYIIRKYTGFEADMYSDQSPLAQYYAQVGVGIETTSRITYEQHQIYAISPVMQSVCFLLDLGLKYGVDVRPYLAFADILTLEHVMYIYSGVDLLHYLNLNNTDNKNREAIDNISYELSKTHNLRPLPEDLLCYELFSPIKKFKDYIKTLGNS